MDVERKRRYILARPAGFSKVIPISVEFQRERLQYRKNGRLLSVLMVDIRPSADSGRSDGMTIKVSLQNGYGEQFREHLRKSKSEEFNELPTMTRLFFPSLTLVPGTSTIRKTVPDDFGGDISIGPY